MFVVLLPGRLRVIVGEGLRFTTFGASRNPRGGRKGVCFRGLVVEGDIHVKLAVTSHLPPLFLARACRILDSGFVDDTRSLKKAGRVVVYYVPRVLNPGS